MASLGFSPIPTFRKSSLVSDIGWYVLQPITLSVVKAVALYSYNGENADELPFTEGDTLSIIDREEADWWKAEKEGVVFIVPAAYLELTEG
jgi:hypothetical protein